MNGESGCYVVSWLVIPSLARWHNGNPKGYSDLRRKRFRDVRHLGL
jgi:hypothetical protein